MFSRPADIGGRESSFVMGNSEEFFADTKKHKRKGYDRGKVEMLI